MLDATDDCKEHLQPDHDQDSWRGFPAGLDLFLAQYIARHRSEPAAALEEGEQHRQSHDLGAQAERDE
jgi:hypothetical protein